MNKRPPFILLLLLLASGLMSQNRVADSLLQLIPALKDDSTKVKMLNDIAWSYFSIGTIDSAGKYAQSGKALGEKTGFKKGEAKANSIIGSTYYIRGDADNALAFYFKSLKLREEINDKMGISASLNNIALIFDMQQNYQKALDIHLRSLKIKEEIGDRAGSAFSYSNIGIIYFRTGRYKEALDFHFKALKVAQETGNKKAEANGLGNIANVYKIIGRMNEALEYYKRSFKIREELGDKEGIVVSYTNLGDSYFRLGKIGEAAASFETAIKKANAISYRAPLVEANLGLSMCDSVLGNYKAAYAHYKLYSLTKDSIFTAEKVEKAEKIQALYDNEKKDKEIQLLNKDKEKQAAITSEENAKNRIIIVSIAAVLLLLFIFSLFLYNRFKITSKQKHIIELQKEMVEEKQKEIVDSITYAQRLQQAILPPLTFIKENLPDHFVMYQPKDIVAGDFYWAERAGDTFFIAAADCTGHGVPGAMVSVVCSNALNRALKEFRLTDPAKILDRVRELVIETFEKSESEVKDGMDISLCALDLKTHELRWAGANNALWYIQNNELKTITPDKQPIGKHIDQKPFTSHSVQLAKNDFVYLFTDGYADQFGGPKGKKLKYKLLQEIITAGLKKPMEEQKAALIEAFNSWKAHLEQIDDVCVIGIRI